MNFLNALGYGGTVAAIGLIVVFFALALLIGFIVLMSTVFKKINKSKAEKAAQKAAVDAPVQAAPVAEPEPMQEVVADQQLIAVITAAIAAFDHSGKNLVVRKVKRVSGWNGSARQEQVYRF